MRTTPPITRIRTVQSTTLTAVRQASPTAILIPSRTAFGSVDMPEVYGGGVA